METIATSTFAARTEGRRSARRENGAAVVEFALVSSLLFTVVIGILQYGLYFNDALGTRNGVREAARQAIVQNFSGDNAAGAACTGDDMAKLTCLTKGQIDPLTGPVYVKVIAPATWDRSNGLTVCAMVDSDGAVGLLPMPNGGWIMSKTKMSIEKADTTPSGTPAPDALPAGRSWSWCTP